MRPQPLICVRDVEASSRWYQRLLNCRSAHGGTEYDRLVSGDTLILQLHGWKVEHHHPPIGDPDLTPHGNGMLLWFELDDFDAAAAAAVRLDDGGWDDSRDAGGRDSRGDAAGVAGVACRSACDDALLTLARAITRSSRSTRRRIIAMLLSQSSCQKALASGLFQAFLRVLRELRVPTRLALYTSSPIDRISSSALLFCTTPGRIR
jgi:hypothetical protein